MMQTTTTTQSFDLRQDEASTEVTCSHFEFVVCALVIGVLCIMGLIGNMTSFFVLWKYTSETATTFLLRGMAVLDSVLLVTSFIIYSLPAFYTYWAGDRDQDGSSTIEWMRQQVWPLAMVAHTATVWITVLVTWNRYCATCRPVGTYTTMVSRSLQLQAAGICLLSILYNIPRFVEHHTISHRQVGLPHDNVTITTATPDLYNISHSPGGSLTMKGPTGGVDVERTQPVILGDNQVYQIIYSNVLYFPVMYIFPLLALTYLNFRLLRNINAIRKKRRNMTKARQKDDHITQIVIVIVFVFILTQTPALINQIFWAVTSFSDRECGRFHYYYTRISDVLVVTNSSSNFIVYVLFGKSFRKIFVSRVICKQNQHGFGTFNNNISRREPETILLQDKTVNG